MGFTRKNQLKRLTNNRKGVSQRRIGRKFNVSHMTICRQLSKMTISCLKHEKTPKYTEKQTEKAKNLLTYYTDRNAAWFWTMKIQRF